MNQLYRIIVFYQIHFYILIDKTSPLGQSKQYVYITICNYKNNQLIGIKLFFYVLPKLYNTY